MLERSKIPYKKMARIEQEERNSIEKGKSFYFSYQYL
jgi:hypothetical protein